MSNNKAKLSLHPKQMEVYLSPARFRVVVAGRRWGKCLQSDTMISMADGSEKPIQNILPGDLVITVNEDTYALEPRKVVAVMDNGVRETLTIRVGGKSVCCTPNHPFLVNNRWVEAKDIRKGDLIASPRQLTFGKNQMKDHELKMLAIWLAEGNQYTISNTTPEILDVVRESALKFDPNMTVTSKNGVDWCVSNGRSRSNPNPFRKMLERLNVWGLNSKTKFIPNEVFTLPKEQLATFLNLMIACDGNISHRSKNTWSVEIQLANELMVKQLAQLFAKFGIQGQIRHKVHKAKSSKTGEQFESWRFITSKKESLIKFADEINALSKEKQVATARQCAVESAGSNNEYLPISYDEFLPHLLDQEKRELGKYGGYNSVVARGLPVALRESLNSWRKQTSKRISTQRYEQLRHYSDGYFDPLADGDLIWLEVTSVENADEAQTWDLSVEGNHNFIADGFVSHNTQLSKTLMIRKAQKPKQRIWYVAPTYRMAKQIMWNDLLEAIPKKWISKVNHSNLSVRLVNGSWIELKGADDPDSLRGVGIDFLVLDEFQDISEEAWTQCLRPTLASTGGHAIFIGTPKAYNQLYNVYMHGQDRQKIRSGQWASWQFPTITSPFIPVSEIEAAKADMDEKSFNQEFLASFETMSGRVYYPFDRKTHVGKYQFNPHLPIWVGMDFNIDPMSTVIMQPQANGEIWVVDEIVQFGSNTEEICDEIDRRYWRHQKQITVYPDPAGGQRQHARGESDLDIMREKGFKRLKFRKKHPLIADRVNSVNRMLKTADGHIKLRINEKCKHLINSFEQTIYKAGGRDVDKSGGVEHSADAIGYAIELEFPMRKIEIGGISL